MIEQCDIVLSVLDGPDADSGTCVELGYARAKGKRIVGVRTDFRGSEDRGLNVMVSYICDDLVAGSYHTTQGLADAVAPYVDSVRMRNAPAAPGAGGADYRKA
jgi:nucleoside 2-deoxyribosyltransferase